MSRNSQAVTLYDTEDNADSEQIYFTELLRLDGTGTENAVSNFTSPTEFKYIATQDNTRIYRMSMSGLLSNGIAGFSGGQYGAHPEITPGIVIFYTVAGETTFLNDDDPITKNADWFRWGKQIDPPPFAGFSTQDMFNFHIDFGPGGIILDEGDEFGIEIGGDLTIAITGLMITITEHVFRIHGTIPKENE